MLDAIRNWKRRRVLARHALPDALWHEALDALPFLATYEVSELARLRERVVLFLADKSIVAADGYAVTPLMRVVIAIQACVLILNLEPDAYDDWENVIVYPDAFVPEVEFVDEAGVVHPNSAAFAGEALHGGPVVLSWRDVVASADWNVAGMNLVIHEFAHKLDMRNGDANGCPPLPAGVSPQRWSSVMGAAYEHFRSQVDADEETAIDPYGAESPAEFFAVLSEVFFSEPALLSREYPVVYELFATFYRQDPLSRLERAAHDGV